MSRNIKWLVVLLFFAGCATVPITGRRQLSLLPQGELVSMSLDNYRQVLRESKLSKDEGKIQLVRKVGKKIAISAEQFMRENGLENELSYYNWEFNLIDDDKTANAFCMPGGKVAVYTGILPLTENENGLAVVIGHEVAHAIANHGNERMSQMLLVELGGVTLSQAVKEKPEETRRLLSLAYGLGTNVGILLPYSRSHELEADRIGLILMARAGYDPRDAVSFWQRMAAKGGGAPPEFLSTHPASSRRIEDIKTYLPEAMNYYSVH